MIRKASKHCNIDDIIFTFTITNAVSLTEALTGRAIKVSIKKLGTKGEYRRREAQVE